MFSGFRTLSWKENRKNTFKQACEEAKQLGADKLYISAHSSKESQASYKAMAELGINKVALVVFDRNNTGNAFWEKQGFTVRDDLIYRNKALTDITRIDT